MQPTRTLTFEKMKLRTVELEPQNSVPDLLGEMLFQNNLEFDLNEKDEIYEAYGRRATVYSYRQENYQKADRKRQKTRQNLYGKGEVIAP